MNGRNECHQLNCYGRQANIHVHAFPYATYAGKILKKWIERDAKGRLHYCRMDKSIEPVKYSGHYGKQTPNQSCYAQDE